MQYGGNKYKQRHWKSNMKIYHAVSELSIQEQYKVTASHNLQTFLIPKHHNKLVSLVGQECYAMLYRK